MTQPPAQAASSPFPITDRVREAMQITLHAQQAGALRALVAGTGPAVAALVAEPGTAARVTRALRASGLIASAVRVDAPVAGARVVG